MILMLLQLPAIPCGVERDIVAIVRFLILFMNLYLGYLIGKRVKESGRFSATTGMMLYLIGNGLFHLGLTLQILYMDWQYSLLLAILSIAFYFLTMASFSLFTEYDIKVNSPNKSPKGFAYKMSIISIIGIVIFIPIIFIYPDYMTIGFIYLLVPFISTSGAFMNQFQKLEILKASRPSMWFSLGLATAGIANFVFVVGLNFMVLIFIQAAMAILGALFMVKGWSALPPLTELKWYLKLGRLMVTLREGVPVFTFTFQAEEAGTAEADGVLAGGALSGVQSILSEILKSKDSINEIDHGDKTIYFEHGKFASYVLFTNGKAAEFHERLAIFCTRFEQKFHAELTAWNGDVMVFTKADEIVKEIFKP